MHKKERFTVSLQVRSSIGFHVARKPPWKFQPAFFFFFFFCCAGSCRRWPPTLPRIPVAIYVLRCVCDSASSSEPERTASEPMGRYRNSFHTTVLRGRSGPLNKLNRRQKWLPRAHSNRASYVLLMHTTASAGLGYDVCFICFSSNFFGNQCDSAKKNTKK